MVISPWNIQNYAGTGIERPAIEHIGFAVESLTTFKQELDQLMESRPELFPTTVKRNTDEADIRMNLLTTCAHGEFQMSDPDNILLDVAEV